MDLTELKQMAVDHPYYCSDNNYYSNDPAQSYTVWPEFYAEFKDADEDYNLCFRWDIKEYSESPGRYRMEIFMMIQRKGIFKPVSIRLVTEADLPEVLEYLNRHWAKMQQLWSPLSGVPVPAK